MLERMEFPGHVVLLCVHACLHPCTIRNVALQLQSEGDRLEFLLCEAKRSIHADQRAEWCWL